MGEEGYHLILSIAASITIIGFGSGIFLLVFGD
jgi:hypothetical protein